MKSLHDKETELTRQINEIQVCRCESVSKIIFDGIVWKKNFRKMLRRTNQSTQLKTLRAKGS